LRKDKKWSKQGNCSEVDSGERAEMAPNRRAQAKRGKKTAQGRKSRNWGT